MKSASKLIDDILDEIQDPAFTRETILGHINSCNQELADKILLPDLADGSGTITTAIDANKVAVPATFHKNIYLAQQDESPVLVYLSLPLMIGQLGAFNLDSGNVTSICNVGQYIYYQNVPSTGVDIDLAFYRVPVGMIDATDSYPDGISNNQNFEDCMFHYGCWKAFKTIEDGIEGAKVNTVYHGQEYMRYRNELKLQCHKFTGPQSQMPLTQKVDTF